jgi:hypothetical protein
VLKRTFFFLTLVSFLVCLISGAQVRAQQQGIGLDSVSNGVLNSAATSLTFSHTVGSSRTNRLLVVGVSFRHNDTSLTGGVTYNGVAMTLSGTSTRKECISQIWYLVAPSTGTHDVVIRINQNLVFGDGVCDTVPGNGNSTQLDCLLGGWDESLY